MKNLVLLSLTDTSRSTFPLHAEYTMGAIGRMTIIMMQIRIDENGLRIGPRPIGEAKEKMIPTYRLTSGAGVNLEMTREIVTRGPFRSSSSSWYFTGVTELIPRFKSLPSKCLASIINSNCRENSVQSNEYKPKHEFFFQIFLL
jgi:hypothetical protein